MIRITSSFRVLILLLALSSLLVAPAEAKAAGRKPVVVTLAATQVTQDSAVLNATVNPRGAATNASFDWGLTTAYGNITTPTSVGSGRDPIPFFANLTGLISGTTYHFRVQATNSAGTNFGADIVVVTEIAPPPPPPDSPAPICNNVSPGPVSAPPGAVTVPAGDNSGLEFVFRQADTTFWFESGVHTLGSSEFSQIIPGDNSIFIGAPGAIVDGQGINRYFTTQHAVNVQILNLEIRGFNAPTDEGVINHDSGNGWLIQHNYVHHNQGGALMAGANQIVRDNCLVDNGQYAMNAFQAGNGITNLLVEHNEIARNNTQDLENQLQCGCTGGIKFWANQSTTVRNNWVHHNYSYGLWADTNNNDFLIEGNLIEDNEAMGVFYEISYNLILQGNTIRRNAWRQGREFAARGDNFPIGAIYLSEADGEPRLVNRSGGKIVVTNNTFANNWGGIVAWANADRFCNSPASTTSDCTLIVGPQNTSTCSSPAINNEPLYTDCRWWVKNLDVYSNTFTHDPTLIDNGACSVGYCGKTAIISNFGTVPSWSPYLGNVIKEQMVFGGTNHWHDNTYIGSEWRFQPYDTSRLVTWNEWTASPYLQDSGSVMN